METCAIDFSYPTLYSTYIVSGMQKDPLNLI